MSLPPIPLEEITESHLAGLIEASVPERQYLDYKRDVYGNADKDKREFLADISSFANTAGGDIVIGMEAREGRPSRLTGVEVNPDAEKLRLESIARDGLQPRLTGLSIGDVPLSSGRHVIIIRIPRSWNPPHRVVAQGSNRFWARNAAGKYEPDVDQLRDLFLFAPSLAEKIRDFRWDRVAKIAAGESQTRLVARDCVVLHLVPFDGMGHPYRFSVSDLLEHCSGFMPIGGMSYTPKVNLEGLLNVTGTGESGRFPAYVQVWKSGVIEAIRSSIVSRGQEGEPVLFSSHQEANLIQAVIWYLTTMRNMAVPPPFALMISMIGLQGVFLDARQPFEDETERHIFDRDIIHASEIILKDFPASDRDVHLLLKPAFDEIANAAGRVGSDNFDAEGNWINRR